MELEEDYFSSSSSFQQPEEYFSPVPLSPFEPSTSWRNNSLSSLLLLNGSFGGNSSSVPGIGIGIGPEETEDFDDGWRLPWWRQLLWTILFSGMVIVASVGNTIVIWIVLAHKRMRTVTNYLLVNLSIADTLNSTINVLPNFIYMLTGHWPFGEFYCKLLQFVAVLSICGSVFSLMAIAFDRYSAIMNPLRPRMGKKLTLGIAGGIWIVGIVISAPHLIFSTLYKRDLGDGEVLEVCYAEWPDGPQTESVLEYWYNVLFMIFTYFVPIGAMGYTYTRVGIELWGSKSIGECTQRQLDNIKSKRRVVKMMIVVVIIFAICWLPFHCYFILVSLWPEITHAFFVREIFLGCYWLAMSNSMYNPLIYCWMNARFRRGFQQVFQWCPFVHYDPNEPNTGVILHPERSNTRRFTRPPGGCSGGGGGGGGGDVEMTTRYSVSGSPDNEIRLNANGTTTVHIPLHVLTATDSRKPGGTTHFLAPPNYPLQNGRLLRSQNNGNNNNNGHHQRGRGRNNNSSSGGGSSEFM